MSRTERLRSLKEPRDFPETMYPLFISNSGDDNGCLPEVFLKKNSDVRGRNLDEKKNLLPHSPDNT